MNMAKTDSTVPNEKISSIILRAEKHIRKLGARRNAPALKRAYNQAAGRLRQFAKAQRN